MTTPFKSGNKRRKRLAISASRLKNLGRLRKPGRIEGVCISFFHLNISAIRVNEETLTVSSRLDDAKSGPAESEELSPLGGLFIVGQPRPAFDLEKRHKFRDEDQRLRNARPLTERSHQSGAGMDVFLARALVATRDNADDR